MFIFGVCVDSSATFDRHCLPGIAAFGGADATLMTSSDTPVAVTYNQVLEASLDFECVEAIVLLRQDVEIVDPHFARKVRAAFADDAGVGILGPTAVSTPQPLRSPTDLDTRCLVLRPDLAARLRFDATVVGGPDGVEVDFCARAIAQGHRVATTSLDLIAHADTDTAGPGEQSRHSDAAARQGRTAKQVSLATMARLAARADDRSADASAALPIPPSGDFVRFTPTDLLDQLPTDARRVLHLGCGAGLLGARIAERSGAQVSGVEGDARQAEIAATMLHQVVALDLNIVTDLPFPDGHFDAVVLDGLLERVLDPAAVLRMTRRCLGPNGRVVATARNVKHWSVVLPLLLEDRWEYTPTGPLDLASVRHFTMGQLAHLFRGADLARFDACLTQQVPVAEPEELVSLVDCLVGYGSDREQTHLLLNTYEFLLVAGPAQP